MIEFSCVSRGSPKFLESLELNLLTGFLWQCLLTFVILHERQIVFVL